MEKTNEQINIMDVKLHYKLRCLNDVNHETRRLNIMDGIEQSYVIRNGDLIFNDPYYKELMDNHKNKLT